MIQYLIFLSLAIIGWLIYGKINDIKRLKAITAINRGTRTERALVLRLLKNKIPSVTIFHDLYLNIGNEKTAQIDIVVPTKVGIIVFEVKDYKGWIYGDGRYHKWTQVLNYGKEKHHFYNPVKQNLGHINHLKKQLHQFQNIPFYSVIVFYGDCLFKEVSFIPEGTWIVKARRVEKVIKEILSNHEPAPYTNKLAVVKVLRQAVENGDNPLIQKAHKEQIKDMLGDHRVFH